MLMFVWSPVRFFHRRMQSRPAWTWAIAAPLACALLELTATTIFAAKNEAMLDRLAVVTNASVGSLAAARLSTLSTVFGYPMLYGIVTFAMICFDILGRDSRNARRIAEFTGIAFAACVPACLFMCLVAVVWVPPPLDLQLHASMSQIEHAIDVYRQALASDPLISTGRSLYYASLAWLVALLACILKVAAGYTTRTAAAAACVLFAAFGGAYLLVA